METLDPPITKGSSTLLGQAIDPDCPAGDEDELSRISYAETTSSMVASSALTFALSMGVPPEQIAFLTGVNPADIAAAGGVIRDDIPPRIMLAALNSGLSSAPAFEMARMHPSAFLSGIECAALYAPTPFDLLKLLEEYSDLIGTRVQVRSEASASYISYHFSHPLDAWDNGTLHEVGVIKTWWLIRGLLGRNAKLAEVSLGFSSNATTSSYQEAFGVPVSFARFAGEHTLVLSKDVLSASCELADQTLYKLGRLHIDQQRRLRDERSASRQMRHLQCAIGTCIAQGISNVMTVAKAAHMSVRSAQRLASQHGTTLSKLIERARFERAQLMILADEKISNAALAYELGYGDERSLNRAFKRRMGLTPSQFKRMVRA